MTQATINTTTDCIKNATDVWNLTPPANINTNNISTAYDTSSIKVDITDTMVLSICKMIRSSYVYNVIPTRILIVSCNNIVLTITTALYAGSVSHVLH